MLLYCWLKYPHERLQRKKRRGGKLDYHWKGPFVITKNLGKGLFQLNELHGDKVN